MNHILNRVNSITRHHRLYSRRVTVLKAENEGTDCVILALFFAYIRKSLFHILIHFGKYSLKIIHFRIR